jgi:uncharacterized membrane protein YfcA
VEIFLPIAHMDVNLLLVLAFGVSIGGLSALTGVGGGFLLTPLLMISGVPPLIAVGTTPALIAGSAAAGSYSHWRLGNMDLRLGLALLAGSWSTAVGAIYATRILAQGGHFDTIVVFTYITILGTVGSITFAESIRAVLRRATTAGAPAATAPTAGPLGWLPGQMEFEVARRRMSVLLPLLLGAFIGVLNALGMGGGFVAVPAMIYLLRVPTRVAIGTSLLLMLATSAVVSTMQASVNHSLDPILALTLIFGSALGAQWGARMSSILPGERLRLLLALILLAVAIKFLFDLLATPAELYSLTGAGT